MSTIPESRWIKIGKYTINLDTIRFIEEHYHDQDAGEGSKVWLAVWCLGESKPVIQLHGDQADALRRYLAFPKRVEDLTPITGELIEETEIDEPGDARNWPSSS